MKSLAFGVAKRGKRVRRLTRLRNKDREVALAQRSFAIAKLGGHIDLHGQPRERFKPVLRNQSCIACGTAGGNRDTLDVAEVEWQLQWQGDLFGCHIDVAGQRMTHDL